MKKGESRRLVYVGASLALSLAVVVAVVGVLGKSRSLFSGKARLHTSFENISGLVVGAPVRLAGVDVGIVEAIRFDPDLRVKDVHVVLGVQARYLVRIREDSIARLSSKGLLGDMLINISVGSAGAAPLGDGAHMRSLESEGLAEVAASVQKAIGDVQALAVDVDKRLKVVLSDDVARDLGRAARSSANIIEKIEKGDGLLHAAIYKPSLARDAAELLSQAQASAGRLNQALGRVDRVLLAVQTGPGALHELLYGDKGRRILDDLQGAVRDIGQVVAEVRGGDGLLHELIYADDAAVLVKDLAAASRAMRTLAEETQQGKGTVGALLKDPTIYEDLKITLGNVSRSRFLKALIRYAIQKDGLRRDDGPRP